MIPPACNRLRKTRRGPRVVIRAIITAICLDPQAWAALLAGLALLTLFSAVTPNG